MTDYIVEDIWEIQTSGAASQHQQAPYGGTPTSPVPLQRLRFSLRSNDQPLPPLTVITAPSGFGKSSLLQQWAVELSRSEHAPLCVRVDRQRATCTQGWTGRGGAATQIDSHQALMPFIRTWLDTRAYAVVLIDDAHLLQQDVAQDLCAFFLHAELHGHALVIATRNPLGVPLARAKAMKRVREVSAATLRLTSDELRDCAIRELRTAPEANALSRIQQATVGWPAAADACIRRAGDIGIAAMLRELQHDSGLMDDFFAEEVLPPLPAPLRAFLIDASVLGVLTAEVCDAALEINDGAALLDDVINAGLFIESMDGRKREFRLHPLFEQYLRTQLMRRGRAHYHAIALRACAWFTRQDRLPQAFDCAIRAEAWDQAAALLDMYCTQGCLTGHGPLVTAMALKLPQDVLGRFPRVAVFAARGANTDWRFGLVEDLLQLARTNANHERSAEVENLVLHSRMLTAQYEDNQIAAGRKCHDLLKNADGFDHYTRGTIFGSLLYARREQFDFTDAAGLEAAGVREFNLSERLLGMVWHLSVVGPTHAMRGDLVAASRRLEEASAIAADLVEAEWITSVPGLLLAEICYERNELSRSRELIDRHHPAPLVGFIDQYVAGYTTGAKLLWLAGDIDGAHRRLDDGMVLADNRSLERLRQSMIGERIRLFLLSGQQQRALDIARQENLLCGAGDVAPKTDCTTRDEMRATSWFRLAMIRGEFDAAIELGQIWKRFTAKAGAMKSAMRWEILLAQAHLAQGQMARAQRELRGALSRAVVGGYIRSFLDEGEQIKRLLQDQLDASTIQTSPTDAFVARLLAASAADNLGTSSTVQSRQSDDDQPASIEPLTRTQIEILQMASAGLQNREIAQRIGMTEGSVKWYMQQIFNKIGVRKRAGALDRARSLGLLA